jgi:hypothetical protein
MVMGAVFTRVFAPDVLAYLSERVNAALREMTPEGSEQKQQAELAKVRTELENIKSAIRQGVITPTTKAMLEEAENRVADLEALHRIPATSKNIAYLPNAVEAVSARLKGDV